MLAACMFWGHKDEYKAVLVHTAYYTPLIVSQGGFGGELHAGCFVFSTYSLSGQAAMVAALDKHSHATTGQHTCDSALLTNQLLQTLL